MREDSPVKFAAGKPFTEEVTAGKLNAVAQQGADIARMLNRSGGATGVIPVLEHWIGKVVDKGPNNEADLAGQQYWVEREAPKSDLSLNAELKVEQDKTPIDAGSGKAIVRATRLTEKAAGGTVVLPRIKAGATAHVFAEVWQGTPTPQTFYYFVYVPSDGAFRVKLQKTSGSRGGKTSAASWVYTVKDRFTDAVIATGKSPLVRVWPSAANDAQWGLADYDADGNLVLVEAFEPLAAGGC